jgi:hypothetical protein
MGLAVTRIFIGVVGFWFWGTIVEVVLKAIGLDEGVSIPFGASEVVEFRECHVIIWFDENG